MAFSKSTMAAHAVCIRKSKKQQRENWVAHMTTQAPRPFHGTGAPRWVCYLSICLSAVCLSVCYLLLNSSQKGANFDSSTWKRILMPVYTVFPPEINGANTNVVHGCSPPPANDSPSLNIWFFGPKDRGFFVALVLSEEPEGGSYKAGVTLRRFYSAWLKKKAKGRLESGKWSQKAVLIFLAGGYSREGLNGGVYWWRFYNAFPTPFFVTAKYGDFFAPCRGACDQRWRSRRCRPSI